MSAKSKQPIIIFFIIGFLCLIISYLTTSSSNKEFFSSALSSVAFVLLTVVIVRSFWELFGGEPFWKLLNDLNTSIQLLKDSQISGLNRVIPHSSQFGHHGDWMKRLKSASGNLDLIGYTLRVWTRSADFEAEIVNLFKKGVKIRILILDSKNNQIKNLLNPVEVTEELKVVNKIFYGIQLKISKLINEKNSKYLGSFEFRRLQKGFITSQICRTDSELTKVEYLSSTLGTTSPLFIIKGKESELFKIYMEEFERSWKQGISNT